MDNFSVEIKDDKVKVNGAFIKDAQPATFKRIGKSPYYMDDLHYFFVNPNGGHGIVGDVIHGESANASRHYLVTDTRAWYGYENIDADPKSFCMWEGYFAKDKDHVYQYGKILRGADAQTFTYSAEGFGNDKKRIYVGDMIITGMDPKSFQLLGGKYMKDASQVLFETSFIKGVDAPSFEMVDNIDSHWPYARDKNRIYRSGKPLEADPSSFQIIGHHTSKDAMHVFYDMDLLEDADPETFVEESLYYSYDKGRAYFEGKLLCTHSGNVETFNSIYLKTSEKVFYYDKELKQADAPSFHQVGEGEYFMADRKHVWKGDWNPRLSDWEARILQDADPKTFTCISSSYAKDSTYVWYYGRKRFKPTDMETFTVLTYEWAKDSKVAYYKGVRRKDVDVHSLEVMENRLGQDRIRDKNGIIVDGKREGMLPTQEELIALSDEDLENDMDDLVIGFFQQKGYTYESALNAPESLAYIYFSKNFEYQWGNGGIYQQFDNYGDESLTLVADAYEVFGLKKQANLVRKMADEYQNAKNIYQKKVGKVLSHRDYINEADNLDLEHFEKEYLKFEGPTSVARVAYIRKNLQDILDSFNYN